MSGLASPANSSSWRRACTVTATTGAPAIAPLAPFSQLCRWGRAIFTLSRRFSFSQAPTFWATTFPLRMTKPLCLLPSIPSHAGSTVAGEQVDWVEPRVLGEARGERSQVRQLTAILILVPATP